MTTQPAPTTHRIERCGNLYVYIPTKPQPAPVHATQREFAVMPA